jgi:hypothetical protein
VDPRCFYLYPHKQNRQKNSSFKKVESMTNLNYTSSNDKNCITTGLLSHEEDDGLAYYTPPKTRYNRMQDIS